MPDGFVSLEAALRAGATLRETGVDAVTPAVAAPPAPEVPAYAPFAAGLALARLAALEAFERAIPRLLEALARDVLARELISAPPDVPALARALAAEFANEEPVAFAIAREDAGRFPAGIPIRVDPRLRAGDLVLEVRDGEIDARFALRLRDAIASAA